MSGTVAIIRHLEILCKIAKIVKYCKSKEII